ncbi:hypothetical protein ACNAW0_28580 [Micromonospora sp. SL1-18]|uniref:hypothetical protein n=1 Tax=Micromonospora sp. SL1-18 TaxID=3399128 RepID=UPI003A4D2084
MRTDDALYRFLHSGTERGNVLVLGHHIFAPGQDPARAEHPIERPDAPCRSWDRRVV